MERCFSVAHVDASCLWGKENIEDVVSGWGCFVVFDGVCDERCFILVHLYVPHQQEFLELTHLFLRIPQKEYGLLEYMESLG